MSLAKDRLSGIISSADKKLEEILLKAYRIGFFDGHVNGANYQRQELATLIEAAVTELAARDAAARRGANRQLAPLSNEHPALNGLRPRISRPFKLWVEVASRP